MAYLGLGSNLGDRRAHLAYAVAGLREAGRVTGASGVYETEPMGYVDQPAFLNAVVRLETDLDPAALMQRVQGIERDRGRIRTFRNGPRTLDIDLLLYGSAVVDEAHLTIPHPRMSERPFVIVPLLELEPEVTDPRTGAPFTEPGSDHEMRRVMSGEELLDASME